jgi:hypothetical protein
MILSVSRRTDVPALYSDWFFDVMKRGEVLVPSPFIKDGKTARVKLQPVTVEENVLGGITVAGNIEGIVFWTKNPAPMLSRLDELGHIPYYFQFTLNAYGQEYETNLPQLDERIDTFVSLAQHCPVVWRYDPLFYTKAIDRRWHTEHFRHIAQRLSGSTSTCMMNTLNGKHGDAYCPNAAEVTALADELHKIGIECGIEVKGCADIINLEAVGVPRGRCIDPAIFERLTGRKTKKTKQSGATRNGCSCMESVDIGTYSTCTNGCIYCYAAKDKIVPLTSSNDAIALSPANTYDRKTDLVFEY